MTEKHIESKILIELFKAGHKKMVPLNGDSVKPSYLTEEDKIKLKEDGIVLDNDTSTHGSYLLMTIQTSGQKKNYLTITMQVSLKM